MKDKGTILVVEDNLETLKMMIDILQPEGYRTLPANSGTIALGAMASQLPDLVLLDIRMPDIGGFEVCRRLKADDRTRHIPIIFLSAEADRNERVEVFGLGAVDFVSKPFHQEELLARINTHLELWRLRRDTEEANCKLSQTNALLHAEITERKKAEAENKKLILELKNALAQVKKLEGIIPICMYCKKIRDDQNSWKQLERYITDHSEAQFSHGMCPTCAQEQMSLLKNGPISQTKTEG